MLSYQPFFISYGQETADSSFNTSLTNDSSIVLKDTVTVEKIHKKKDAGLEDPVKYTAEDSIIYDLDSQKVYLYGKAIVTYQDIKLEADYVKFDMANKEVFSHGMPDSSGVIKGKPIFTQGNDKYNANTIRYNFNTRKAFTEGIITEQQGGFLHSEESKRQQNEQIHSLNNKFTTCDREHPHFYIALKKAIVVPNKKIISGPAYFVIEDVPIYFPFLPFGFFPTPKKRSSGILVPTFGDEPQRGFYLRDLGYYWPINDYLDLTLRSEIFTKGTIGLNSNIAYVKRYKYNGNAFFKYYKGVSGEKGFEDYQIQKDFSLQWSHRQDSKANPTQTFSASVNISTSKFDKEYSRETDQMFQNTKQSSVNYTKKWDYSPFGTPVNFSTSLTHNQNNTSKMVNVNLPKANLSTGNIYLFPKHNEDSKRRFWHDIRTKYTANLDNSYSNPDSTFFENFNTRNMKSGFKHTLPITLPAKFIKFLPINISIGYEGYAYTKHFEYVWDPDIYTQESTNDSVQGGFRMDTIYGLEYVNVFNYIPSFNNMTLNRNMYVTLQNKKEDAKVQAVRYVLIPAASLSYTPGRKGKSPYYYKTAYGPNGEEKFYSIYDGSTYTPPGVSKKTSSRGSISLSLDNNLEMKVRSKNDSITEPVKVKVLESLKFSTSYNIFADSLNWSKISMTTGTNLFKNAISINVRGTFDPYILDPNLPSRNVNRYELTENSRLARLTYLDMKMSLNFGGKKANNSPDKEHETKDKALNDYDYFDIPWSFSASYGWTYTKQSEVPELIQVLTFNGSISPTKGWKISYQSGYDIKDRGFVPTSINIHRNLHCWEMSLQLVPFGSRKYFEFRINAVSSLLKDLKYEFERDDRRYYY